MAIKAMTPGTVRDFISKRDVRPPLIEATESNPTPDNSANENYKPTRWQIRTLDSRVLGILRDKSTKITIDPNRPDDEIGTVVSQNGYNFEVCSLGIEGVSNFLDDKDREVKYTSMKRNLGGKSYDVASPDFLMRIDLETMTELAEAILAANGITVVEGNV